MKHLLNFSFLVFAIFSLSSCEKDYVENGTFVTLHVMDQTGLYQSGVPVYVFYTGDGNVSAKNPLAALDTRATDESGMVQFNLADLDFPQTDGTASSFEFKILEPADKDEYRVLGYVELSISKGEVVSSDIVIK